MRDSGDHGRHWRRFLAVLFLSLSVLALPERAQNTSKSVVDLDGRPVDPFQRTDGKIVVLLFVRTDCPVSNRYAPTIQEMSARYGGRAAFYLVYPVRSETTEQIRKHLNDFGYHLAALRDPELALVHSSQVHITPEAAVFGVDGRLLYHGRIDDWYEDFGRARRAPTTHELSEAIGAAIAGKNFAKATAPAVGCFIPGVS
jgi:thiol-disulfide isomerase/thioredoxin